MKEAQLERMMERNAIEMNARDKSFSCDLNPENATQEVFIKAYNNMESFRGEATEKTWLTSIAMNVCKNYGRTSWFKKVQIGIEKIEGTYIMEEELTARVERSDLLKQVMGLSKKYREVILLYYYQELKISEIAQILGISESSVKMRLSRAKGKLKEELEEGYIYG